MKYEKEGYETTYSDWLPVPPPQTEVNIGMVSLAEPNISYVNIYEEYAEIEFSKYMVPLDENSITITTTNNEIIPYTLEYDMTQTDLSGSNYAKYFKLKFHEALSEGVEYNITINSCEDYAGIYTAEIPYTIVCEKEISMIVTNMLNIPYGTSITIPISLSANRDITLLAQSSFDDIITVKRINCNEMVIDALIPGEAVITISADGVPTLAVIKVVSTIGENILPGDVNGDGTVDKADNKLLSQYFARHDVDIMEINAAQIDGDGILTRRDAMILARHIAGWEGYTLPSIVVN